MMKFHAAITTGLATLIVVPTAVLDEGELRSLENTLSGTVRALEVLAGIQERADTDPRQAALWIRSATEPPILDDRERDERLVQLRNEVNLMQMELDSFSAPTSVATTEKPGVTGTVQAPFTTQTGGLALQGVTTGLSDAARRALAHGPSAASQSEANPPTGTTAPAELPPREEPGYTADPLGHARACYKAGRYEDGIAVLETLRDDIEALYWKARCLEKLGRLEEAEVALENVATVADGTWTGQRARTDLEFVRWKREFTKRMPDAAKGGQR